MYAGVFALNKGNFFHCEEQEFTAPVPGWLVFVFLVIELKVVYWLSSHWLDLKNAFAYVLRFENFARDSPYFV